MSTPTSPTLRRIGALLLPGPRPVTTLMMLFCVAGWVLVAMVSGDIAQFRSLPLLRSGSNFPALTMLGGEGWRLFSYMFLHGGLLHLAFNLYALWVVGRMVEGRFGGARFTFLYIIGGVLAGLASAIGSPLSGSVGASGAIMAVIGAGVVAGHMAGTRIGEALRNQLLVWFAIIMGIGLLGSGAGLRWDNWAHGGGFVAGLAIGLLFILAERARRSAPNVEAVAASLLFVLTIAFALTPHVLYRDVPLPASEATAMQEANRQLAWRRCAEPIRREAWDEAWAPCRDYRLAGLHWRRGHVVLVRLAEIREQPAQAQRARNVLRQLDEGYVVPSLSRSEAIRELQAIVGRD